MKYIGFLLLYGCASDIAIITTEKKQPDDTAEVTGVGEPTDDPWNPNADEPSAEPS